MLVFREWYSGEFTEHFEQFLYIILLQFDPAGFYFLIVIFNDLFELSEFGVVIEEEGVDGHEVEPLFVDTLLPPHQFDPLLQLGLRNFHLI